MVLAHIVRPHCLTAAARVQRHASSAHTLHGTPLEVAAAGGPFHPHGLSLPGRTHVRSRQTAAGSGPYRGLVRESSCYTWEQEPSALHAFDCSELFRVK